MVKIERDGSKEPMVMEMMEKVEKMKACMMGAGVYSAEDVEEVCRLETEYARECEQIARGLRRR